MLDKIDNAKKFESPASVVLARGISIKIKDIPKNTTLKGRLIGHERDTNFEKSLKSEKEIVVPSFGHTGALFARHFDILRNLKRRIHLLKQAYQTQVDSERSWDQVALIIKTLEKGCKFLDFDEVHSVKKSKPGSAGSNDEAMSANEDGLYEDPTLIDDELKMN